MKVNRRFVIFEAFLLTLVLLLTGVSNRLRADTGTCGGQSLTLPFTDVPAANTFFCTIAAAYFSGLTNGTDATHYSPSANVTREQMSAFTTRTLDQSVKRASRRSALGQWWTPRSEGDLAVTTVENNPISVVADGTSLWVANKNSASVTRVTATTGGVIGTATGLGGPNDLLVAKGRVFVIEDGGALKSIDPTSAALPVTTVASGLGTVCTSLAFDGSRIWVASNGSDHISRITLSNPATVDTYTGFVNPTAVLYDGANIWVTEANRLKKIDPSDGSVDLTVTLTGASFAGYPTFDGTNLWVPTSPNQIFIVRASTTTDSVLQVLTGNGLANPYRAAFDGERVLVINNPGGASLWKASSLSPITSFSTTNSLLSACSDGINFWVTMSLGNSTPGKLLRF